jgi:hypothetical protein
MPPPDNMTSIIGERDIDYLKNLDNILHPLYADKKPELYNRLLEVDRVLHEQGLSERARYEILEPHIENKLGSKMSSARRKLTGSAVTVGVSFIPTIALGTFHLSWFLNLSAEAMRSYVDHQALPWFVIGYIISMVPAVIMRTKYDEVRGAYDTLKTISEQNKSLKDRLEL